MSRQRPERPVLVQQLAGLVSELLDKVETRERFYYQPSRDHPKYSDRRRKLPMPTRRTWKTTDQGLIAQLAVAAGERPVVQVDVDVAVSWCSLRSRREYRQMVQVLPVDARLLVMTSAPLGGRSSDGPARSGAPESRPPGSTAALEEYLVILGGIDELRRRVRRAAGRSVGERRPPDAALREILGLLQQKAGDAGYVVDDRTADHAAHQIRSWRSSARIALGYDVPIIQLPQRHCLECGGKLFVRSDASSDVWCGGGALVAGPAREGERFPVIAESCGAVWPRHTWIQLLTPAAEPDDEEPTERKEA